MKKILIIAISLLLLTSCKDKEVYKNSIPPVNSDKSETVYDLKNKTPGEILDSTNLKDYDQIASDFKNKVDTTVDGAYKTGDIKNLDYNKKISLFGLSFLAPDKTKIQKTDSDIVSFTLNNPNFNISYYVREVLDKNNNYKAYDIRNSIYKLADDIKNEMFENIKDQDKLKLTQDTTFVFKENNPFAYFVTEDGAFLNIFCYVACENNVVEFHFEEQKLKSNDLFYIFSDTMASLGKDENFTMKKDFDSYETDDSLNDYFSFEQFTFNIPSGFNISQDNETLKIFERDLKGEIVNQLIITSFEKKDKDLLRNYPILTGENLPPAQIYYISPIREKSVCKNKALTSKIRFYMDGYTQDGNYTLIDAGDKLIAIILTGVISDMDDTVKLNKEILDNLQCN